MKSDAITFFYSFTKVWVAAGIFYFSFVIVKMISLRANRRFQVWKSSRTCIKYIFRSKTTETILNTLFLQIDKKCVL